MISYDTRFGSINLSAEYLTKLIGKAVTSCYGVAGMAPVNQTQKIAGFLTRKENLDRGIKVTGNAKSVKIELHIIVTYGMNINAIAESIVHKVKYTVKEITDTEVESVSVKVDGIKE